MAHAAVRSSSFAAPAWKTAASLVAAVLLGLLFIVAGVWKITDPIGAGVRLSQAMVPAALSLPAAVLLGIGETFAGVLILVPRFRRWGAWLTGALLLAFLAYMAINYNALRGNECNCFPWIKRVVGAGFFIGDVVMLVFAIVAGLWARSSVGRRSAGVILGAVTVFALACYGVTAARENRATAPASITVNGKPFALHQGKVFLYFFDPECSHCDAAARQMSRYAWNDVTVIGVPTDQPQFAQEFMQSTGLHGAISNDVAKLRASFSFKDAPYAVALIDGRQKAALTRFDRVEPEDQLRSLGFVR